jgi:hypothetical protein
VTHHPFPPEEAASACFTHPCHFVSKGLKPGTSYTFWVQADNHAGLGARSDPITIVTPVNVKLMTREERDTWEEETSAKEL